MEKGIWLYASLIALLISVSILSADTKSVFATDNWGLSPIQNYVDTNIRIDCTPYGQDTDNDGICDNWETPTGLHIAFSQGGINYSYDLPCDSVGCPVVGHKDVYVELDYMTGHGPNPTAIADVVNAFNNSPVTNTVGGTGVHLHVQYGEHPENSDGNVGVLVTSLKVRTALWNTNIAPNYGVWVLKENRFGTVDERTNNANHLNFCKHSDGSSEPWHDCGTAKRQVFHYALFIHNQFGSDAQSSGYAEILGNDLIVSLGNFADGVNDIDEQEAAFMHELGHNLNLYHGGGAPPDVNANGMFDQTDDNADNCKPNYLSIMSYTYEFRATNDVCRPLDYSRSQLNSLDENNLIDKSVGTYNYPPSNANPPDGGSCSSTNNQPRSIWYSNPSGVKTMDHTGSTVNWNAPSNTSPYPQNLNAIGVSGSACTDTNKSLLSGHDDWSGLGYVFIVSGLSSTGNVTESTQSSQCDGISKTPIGYVVSDVMATSEHPRLGDMIANIGGIALESGISGTSNETSDIAQIIVPGVEDMTKDLAQAAKSSGATYVPADELQASGTEGIPVYSLSKNSGDPLEWSCSAHADVVPIIDHPPRPEGATGPTGPSGPTGATGPKGADASVAGNYDIMAFGLSIAAIIIAIIAIIYRRK